MSRYRTLLLVVTALMACCPGQAAIAAGRVALLIGNSAYPGNREVAGGWTSLPNAVHDIELIANALRNDGFTVTKVENGTYSQITDALAQFVLSTGDADTAVFYYAGHGFEYDRKNYLVPIDGPASVDSKDLPNKFVSVDQIVNASAQAAKENIYFLDACRTAVPFVTISATQDAIQKANTFSDVEYPEGAPIAIIYSTARGEPALNSAPPPPNYSPFAWSLARDIVVPHIEFGYFAERLRTDVISKTNAIHPQYPYWDASIGPGFYFNDVKSRPIQSTETATIRPLNISLKTLATTDEPILIVGVLREHPVAEMEALGLQGDPIATYLLGYMYEFGVGVPVDLAKSRMWLEKAAAQNTPAGQLELGYFLENHSATPGDQARALTLYEASAAQGYAKAQGHLAEGYMDGRFGGRTAENYSRGLALMKSAATGGYPYAMFVMAEYGDEAERPGWMAHLRSLANAGDPQGNQWLCELAASRNDYQSALPDCLVAAKAGNSASQARLAVAFHDGLGVKKSDEEAIHWTRLALAQKDLREDLRTPLVGFGYVLHKPAVKSPPNRAS